MHYCSLILLLFSFLFLSLRLVFVIHKCVKNNRATTGPDLLTSPAFCCVSGQMSDGRDRGERRRLFLSTHRCPEVDFLPHQDSETQLPPLFSQLTTLKKSKLNSNYLEVSTQSSEDIDDSESFSDWSDEDLSLHLPPSVILQSEDEESDPESSFECVDINMETLVSLGHYIKIPGRELNKCRSYGSASQTRLSALMLTDLV